MTEERPDWWPKNPYATSEPRWSHKPDNELMWEEASDDCFEAWKKYVEKYKIVINPK